MGRAILSGQSGGIKINGLESNCIVADGQSIKKGDFVELFRNPANTPNPTDLLGTSFEIGSFLAEEIINNKIFIAYYNRSDAYIYADVLQRNEDGTIGSITQAPVKLDSYGGNILVSLKRIRDTKVILQYDWSNQDRKYKVLSFNGSSLLVGNTYAFSNSSMHPETVLACDSTHIATFSNSGNSSYMNVLTLSGNNIVASSSHISVNASAAMQSINLKMLPNGKIIFVGVRNNHIVAFYICFDPSTETLSLATSEVLLKYIQTSVIQTIFFVNKNLFYSFNTNLTNKTYECQKIKYDEDALTVSFVETEVVINNATSNMSEFRIVKLSGKKMILSYSATSSGSGYPEYILYNIATGEFNKEYTYRMLNIRLGGAPYYLVNDEQPKNISSFYINPYPNYMYYKQVKISEYGRKSSMNEKCNGISKGSAGAGEVFKLITQEERF